MTSRASSALLLASVKLRVRGLEQWVAAMLAAALVEILTPGEGQVHAVLMHTGAMPHEARTYKALRSLDPFVTHRDVSDREPR